MPSFEEIVEMLQRQSSEVQDKVHQIIQDEELDQVRLYEHYSMPG